MERNIRVFMWWCGWENERDGKKIFQVSLSGKLNVRVKRLTKIVGFTFITAD